MLNRNAPLVVCLTLLSGAALAQQPQGVGYAVEFASSASGQLQAFPENTATFATSSITVAGPAGPGQVIAKPDGSKFYLVGSTALDSIDPAFTTPKTINGLTGTFSKAVISPDGRYLLLAASQGSGSGSVYVLNTTNDSVVLNQNISGSIIGMVVSRDSSTAWILGESSGTFITTINLTNQQQSGTPIFLRDPATGGALGGDATSLNLSPMGLLYATAGNQILEINPTVLQSCQASPLTCAPAVVISVNATPGPLQFTPDGAYAYFVNQTPTIGGQSILRLGLPGHSVVTYPSLKAFDNLVVAGQNRILAHSVSDNTLWDVASDLSTVSVSTLQSVLPATSVYSIAISDELPSAQYLFVTVGGPSLSDVYLVSLSSNSVIGQAATSLGLGPLQFVFVPSQSPSGFTTPLAFNTTQIVQPGATAAPLIARVLDQNGNPVFAVPVTFTGDTSLTISPPTATTNADGYVQASVKVGSNPGPFPVTLTAGTGNNTVTATFTLTVPGPTGPGGGTGTGNGPNQLSIVTGNGQLFQAGSRHLGATNDSLGVQLVDTTGKPMANQSVTFAVTGPQIGVVLEPNGTTDVNGMASTDFSPGYPPQSTPFESTTVTATATDTSGNVLGAVNFTETMYQTNQDGTGQPTVQIYQLPLQTPPVTVFTLQGGEGDVLSSAFKAVVTSGSFGRGQGVPNVGIRIADATDPNLNGPGTCQGNPVTDQTGTVICNFIPACPATLAANGLPTNLGLHGFDIVVGEYESSTDYGVVITTGSSQTLSIPSNGGNNQSGTPGSALPLALTATATDSCGNPAGGITVTWKVTQGSATLSNATSQTGAGGFATTKVTLGSAPGTTTITATINGTSTVNFTETTNAVVGSLTLVSGTSQSAVEGAAFAQPLVFALKDNKSNPLSGVTVNFALGGGSATLSVKSAVTNSLGQASVAVTAGPSPGTVTVNATYSTFTASASLTVTAPGLGLTGNSFVNAASLQAGLVPCGLATVTGAGLAPGVSGIVPGNSLGIGPLGYTVAGVSISVDGSAAPILSVSNQGGVQQVNFQTPCEVPTGSATVVVQVSSSTTTITGVTVYPTQPGIFTYAGPGGLAYGWIISAKDGSYLTPSNLAHPGQTYYLVATGLGQTSPNAVTNAPGTGNQTIPVSQITLAINNIGVPVTSVQYVQGAVGEYIITFTIPTTANGQPFPTGTNLPIELGGLTSGGQTIFDNSVVAIPGIQ